MYYFVSKEHKDAPDIRLIGNLNWGLKVEVEIGRLSLEIHVNVEKKYMES